VCWFRNLEGRDPRGESDDVYLACIRRANLDAMLGKSPLTMEGGRVAIPPQYCGGIY